MNRTEILDGAREAIKDRGAQYGSLGDNFTNAAALWTVALGVHIEPWQVALCQDLFKTARIVANPTHKDSWVDKAGYAAIGAELVSLDPK